jgi:hypothetical protein
MTPPITLPLPLETLPEQLRRFADPAAPGAARMMAARGMVPVKGAHLVMLLTQLTADPEEAVREAASATLNDLPNAVLLPAAEVELPAAVLHAMGTLFGSREDILGRLAANHAVADETIVEMATHCPDPIVEIIAVNQQRLLRTPRIIEALYKNRNTRMSTADRLIELAARHGVKVTGIPMFDEIVKSLRGGTIPEASAEPTEADQAFAKTLSEDGEQDAIKQDQTDGTEETKEEFKNLQAQIRDMSIGQKIRLALLGNAAARSLLLRDPNRIVAMAAIGSPAVSDTEAKNAAQSREVSEDVLRYIAKKREWVRSYEIKHALCKNPKTPLALSMNFLNHLRRNDLQILARSRGIPAPLKQAAKQRSNRFG